MSHVHLILLVAFLLFELLAAFGVPPYRKSSFIGAGLACYAASLLF